MKSFRSILGSALVVLGILLIFLFRTPISERLFSFSIGLKGMTDSGYSYGEFLSMKSELIGLRAEIKRLQEDSKQIRNRSVIEAKVFSRFPMNTRDFFIIDGGSEVGIKEGMAVFADADQTLLLGRITRVSRFQSEMNTFFDPEWKSSVEVGDKKIKALLVGGNPPHIDLLPKDAEVASGMLVTNADAGYPFGAFLGTLEEPETEANEMWRKATLDSVVLSEALGRVFVSIEFP